MSVNKPGAEKLVMSLWQQDIRQAVMERLAYTQSRINWIELTGRSMPGSKDVPLDQLHGYRDYLHGFIRKLEKFFFDGNDGLPSSYQEALPFVNEKV